MIVYLDTNIFIYLANSDSVHHEPAVEMMKLLIHTNSDIYTSVETIQEIMHVSKKLNQLSVGIKTAQLCMELVSKVIPIDEQTIELFLEKSKKYQLSNSRDIMHIAVCIENNITQVITLDGGFKNYTEIKALTPLEFIKIYAQSNDKK